MEEVMQDSSSIWLACHETTQEKYENRTLQYKNIATSMQFGERYNFKIKQELGRKFNTCFSCTRLKVNS